MKLVQILARELEKWPEGNRHAWQDHTGEVRFSNTIQADFFAKEMCDDHVRRLHQRNPETGVTRAQWQAERERIAKPGKKANSGGWIRHRGGKCPVEAGTLVDVRYRGAQPGVDGYSPNGEKAGQYHWRHDSDPGDIMAYRIRKPAEQPETVSEEVMQAGIDAADAGKLTPIADVKARFTTDGPLQWRDRILEIDRTVEALEEERVSLIQRLEGEGLQLLQGKVCGSVQPAEDISDPRLWKVGDCLRAIGSCGGFSFHGQIVKVLVVRDYGGFEVATEDEPDYGWYFTDIESATDLEFHSRPSA